MKKLLLVLICALVFLFGFEQLSETQTKKEKSLPEQSQNKPKVVALNTNELEAFTYDAGKVKFIATSDDTNNEYAVVELTEMPGYKTAWHQHNNCEEAFYVVEGVLTLKIADKISEFPAGSYILIPRGTIGIGETAMRDGTGAALADRKLAALGFGCGISGRWLSPRKRLCAGKLRRVETNCLKPAQAKQTNTSRS